VPDPAALASGLADQLGLVWPGIPWHTRRTPVTRLGDTLVQVVDALGVIAADILLLGRPEIAEVHERRTPGRGGSSTMPHKQNPVLAVLIRSSALQAPLLAAQLHLCAAEAVDERPDGAWHAEWPALQRLLGMTAVAAAQAAELVPTLDVDAERMADRARAAAAELLAERGFEGAAESGGPTPYLGAEGGDPTTYLGAATAFVDTALTRYRGGNRG
jgi:3-carboxy-cis,cis-muconate cycloisomerase